MEVRRFLRVLPLAVTAAGVAVWLPEAREFLGGLVAGAAGMALRARLRAPKLPAAGDHRSTERELVPLEKRGWAVAHEVPVRGGTLDHLAVGPTGAHLLETKAFTGAATLEDGTLVVRRGDQPADTWRMNATFAGRLRRNARDARQLLGAANIAWVQPVVVLWCDFPDRVAEHGGVAYVHGSCIADWLERRPRTVSPETVEMARGCLRRLEDHAASAA